MSEGCFNLRIFESNVASKSVDKHSGETFILGIIWDLDNDVLKCCTNFDSLTCEVKITKRLVLSTVQKVFDPIGMLAPSTLLPKLLLQEIWKMKKAWDQELPQNIVNKFMKWFNEIQILKDVTVPRCMKIDIFTELHVFVDASKGSYAGCVFARSIVDSRVSEILVRAKSRVAPLKLLSIPHLELMACCVGVRLVNSILKALNMPDLKVTLWSDSTTALWWIKEYGNWSVFVANRVKEIRQLTQIQSWKYVPGNMNVADLLSRGCSPRQMLNSKWWEGPSWLKQNSEYWPDGEISCEPQEVNVERKKTKNANVDLANDAPLLLICNVSDYDKMIRVLAWILRFVNNCRKDYNKCKEHELSVAEIENSEKQLIRLSQTYYLPDIESLKFVTFIDDDNILRVKSKITERNEESSFLYPILLPDKCEFTKLLIRSIHKKNCHAGIQIMQSLIRERRFIARRGRSRIIYCDNGTNFRGAFNDLAKLDWHKISRETSTQKIVWKFIPPTAAWWGGWWERLVRIIKKLLRRSLGKSISVKSTKPEKVLNINDAIIKKYTSSGRLVKEPMRLDLLNYNCYRFETLPKSQRGEYVVNGDDLCE
ncbi:integrase catalytic domain-containing protein [Trichonephila clavipes]|nr:integrase catalytic domain-containing protein [Trichonephila clavipes]